MARGTRRQEKTPDDQGSQKSYYKQWYDANREEVLARRAEKYRKDPAYREKALQRSREWWRNQPREPRERNIDTTPPQRHMTPRVIEAGGERAEVVSSGLFARMIGYSFATTFEWRSTGILPPPTLKDDRGRYWYGKDYIDMVNRVLDGMALEPWNLQVFKERLWEEFRATVGRRPEYAGTMFEGIRVAPKEARGGKR